MPNQELLDYIKKAKEAGQTDEQIKTALLSSGWQEIDIKEVLYSTNNIETKKPARKVLIVIIAIALILLAGGVLAYWKFVMQKQANVVGNQEQSQTPASTTQADQSGQQSNNNQNNNSQIATSSSQLSNTSTWQESSNDYVSFLHPANWTIRGITPGSETIYAISPDSNNRINLIFTVIQKTEMNKNITDIYSYAESIEPGTVSNKGELTIDNNKFQTYDVKGAPQGDYTVANLVTQNYFYSFTFNPGISNSDVSKIINTIKIKKQ